MSYRCRQCKWAEETDIVTAVCLRCKSPRITELDDEALAVLLDDRTLQWCKACQKYHTTR